VFLSVVVCIVTLRNPLGVGKILQGHIARFVSRIAQSIVSFIAELWTIMCGCLNQVVVTRDIVTGYIHHLQMTSFTASQEEAKAALIPLSYRDHCSALLIPLNVCRRKNNYMTWHCEHERHTYEKCQYDDYMRRMKELSKRKLAAANNDEE